MRFWQTFWSREEFRFGKNWQDFLAVLTEERVMQAEEALKEMLSVSDLTGKSFIDVGSGSGLASLAARRLGATVYSFDNDRDCVSCTKELKKQYFPNDLDWVVAEGSVLNVSYLNSLGQFDIVYVWGVLHHTGAMWEGLRNVIRLMDTEGQLFVAIYNDQRWISSYWSFIKLIYNKYPKFRWTVILFHMPYLYGLRLFCRSLTGRRKLERGMSLWHDMIDWLGGYPFEVAKPEEVFEFCSKHGLIMVKLKTCSGRLGCNEFVFRLASAS